MIIDWNNLTIEGPHCIAYMADYITHTDPLSQRTRTVGEHTTHAWPIYIYRPIDERHGGHDGGILKTAVDSGFQNTPIVSAMPFI